MREMDFEQRKRTEEEREQCDLHDDVEEGLVTVIAVIVIQGSRCLYACITP